MGFAKTHKVCVKCRLNKTRTGFPKNKGLKDGLDSYCLECHRIAKKRYESTAKGKNTRKNSLLVKAYGITLEQYTNLLVSQDYRCAICSSTKPGRARDKYFSVDHCHRTGRVRGLLCSRCNRGLGIFEDRVSVLENAANYLRGR